MMLLRACYGVRGSFPSLAATAAATVVSVSLGKSTVALCYGCIATLLRRSRSVAPLSLERVLLLRTTARSGAVSDLCACAGSYRGCPRRVVQTPFAPQSTRACKGGIGVCGSSLKGCGKGSANLDRGLLPIGVVDLITLDYYACW